MSHKFRFMFIFIFHGRFFGSLNLFLESPGLINFFKEKLLLLMDKFKMSFLHQNLISRNVVVLTAVLCFVLHCSTLSLSPITWMDEVMIVDYGKTVCEQINVEQAFKENKAVLPYILFYPGCTLHYLANCLFPRGIGPRALALLCHCLGVIVLWRVLEGNLKNPIISKFVAFLWLVDPYITQSVRGGRCDAEVFLLFFSSLFFLYQGIDYICQVPFSTASFRRGIFGLALSSLLVTLCVFFWITGLIPAIAYMGVAFMLYWNKRTLFQHRVLYWAIGVIALTAVLISVILLSWLPVSLNEIFSQTTKLLSSPAINSTGWMDKLFGVLLWSKFDLFSQTWLLAIVFVIFLRFMQVKNFAFIPLAITLLVGILLATLSSPYVHRVIYIFPNSALLLGYIIDEAYAQISDKRKRLCLVIQVCFALYVVGLFAYTVGGRTILAVCQYQERTATWIYHSFAKSQVLHSSQAKIYCEISSLYYVSLERKWVRVTHPNYCDIAVFEKDTALKKFPTLKHDFELVEIIENPCVNSHYGSFEIWQRKKHI